MIKSKLVPSSNALTAADFAALKITGVNAGNLALVLAQLARQPDDGSNTNTWARLADAVFTVTNVPAINTIASDDIINLAERNAGVTLTGTAGKDDTVTLFYPDGGVMKSGIVTRDSGTGTSVWNWSYTLSEADWRALGADGANGIDKIIGIQSRNNFKGIDSIKVTHTVTLDTKIPVFGAPVRLELDSGQSASDGVTKNGKVLVNGVEAGASWSYRIDDGAYQPGSRGSFIVPTDGSHTVKVRQTDKAGNDSVEQTLSFTLDTAAPPKLSAVLVKDTGSSGVDRLTNDGSFSVNGIEPGASWQWSDDNGISWNDGVGLGARIKGAADGAEFVDGLKNVVLRQVDVAGNVGPVSDVLSFTLDTTAPSTPVAALRRDTGISGSDRITNDGTVGIDKLESTSSWQYSVDGGTTWIDGSALSVNFPGAADGPGGSDGAKNVLMRQVDEAGNASAPTPGRRTIDITLVNAGKLVGPAVQATLAVSSDNLLIDLDPKTAGQQLAATQIVTDATALAAGVAFDADVGVPSATNVRALRVSLDGAGLNPKTDKLMLDVPLDLSTSLSAVDGRTVGGVPGLSYAYDVSTRTLEIRKTDGSMISGSQLQSLMQAIKLGGPVMGDGVRKAGFALISNTGETGGTSTVTLLVDLDGTPAGRQNSAAKSISAARAMMSESLFPQETVVQQANDIVSIKLLMSGAALDLGRDKLVLDLPVDLNASTGIVSNRVIGGVAGLSYRYDDISRTLTISKNAGLAMTSDEVSSILKAIQFKNAAPQGGDRLASLTLTDLAGNSSTASLKLNVDTTVPASLKAALVAGNQLSYKMLSLPDVAGADNKHKLRDGQGMDLSSLMPGGGDAASLLSSLKGIYAEWGSQPNTVNPAPTSVMSFPSSPGFNSNFSLIHQSGSVVKGENYFFTARDGKTLTLNERDGFAKPNTDVFAFDGGSKTTDYDIASLRLLFQVPTANANTQPTIQVSFDGSRAAAGDVIRLMEGDQILASRTLREADLGGSNVTLNLSPASSLSPGQHTLSSKYIDVAGNTVVGNDLVVNIAAGVTAPVLTDLKVSGGAQAPQAINDSTTRYAMVSEAGGESTGSSGLPQNLSFSGTVGKAGSGHKYLIMVSMGGKLLAFDQFAAGDFKLDTPANVLAPGLYKDLSVVAIDLTDGPSNGQSATIGGQTLAWYWVPQNLPNLTAGAGDDLIPLGATLNGLNSVVQTGLGKDSLLVGAFGVTDPARLMSSVSDFTLGMDKVRLAGQNVTAANLDRFVTASPTAGGGTKLFIDLDGAGPGNLSYTLVLQNLPYAQSNIQTIFGV